MVRRSEKDQKTAIEGWIDERIQFALAGFTQPLEKKVARLRERVQALQIRIQQISKRIEEDEEHDHDTGEDPGEEPSRG